MSMGPLHIRTKVEHPRLRELYGEREPFSWAGTAEDASVPVSAFANDEGPHWHYVALGAREVLGHELTFRLAAPVDESSAPRWPVELLRRIARHALGCENAIGDGWYVCFEEPIDPSGKLRCVAIVEDPQLPEAWQAVGLHEDELALVSEDGYEVFLRALRAKQPLLVTEPARDPVRPDGSGSAPCA